MRENVGLLVLAFLPLPFPHAQVFSAMHDHLFGSGLHPGLGRSSSSTARSRNSAGAWFQGKAEIQPIPACRNSSVLASAADPLSPVKTQNLAFAPSGYSGNDYPPPPPGTCRFVIVMSRPVRETIDLPKPAAGDILYLQTEQGWKVFPSSAHTVARTVRLTFSGPEPHLNIPSTRYSVDVGLGHPDEILFLDAAFSWLPEQFQAPLPSLPDQPHSSSEAPLGPA